MKNLTYSDQVNIEAFKQLLKMLSNDIKEAKQGNTPPNEKAHNVFKLSIQRADLLQNAQKNYPQINWINNIESAKPMPFYLKTSTSRKLLTNLLQSNKINKQSTELN